MLCPLCQETLQLTDRQGVEIDYCPKCRGVWLDRGELQKLIDLSFAAIDPKQIRTDYALGQRGEPPVVAQHSGDKYRHDDRRYEHQRYDDRKHDSYSGYGKPKKRESWFSELFDFD